MSLIHPSALVSPTAEIGANVEIGPFSIIDEGISIGDNTKIEGHVWITGNTTIGENNTVGYGSIIGAAPQDKSFNTAIVSSVIIGDFNTIREYVTIHRSGVANGATQVGDHNYLMTGVHIASDTTLGDDNTLGNNVLLASNISVADKTFLGGGAGFHPNINIGSFAVVQGNATIGRDVPPYCIAHSRNSLSGLNTVGLKQGGFSSEQRREIKFLFNLLFNSKLNLSQAVAEAQKSDWSPAATPLLNAAISPSSRGVLTR